MGIFEDMDSLRKDIINLICKTNYWTRPSRRKKTKKYFLEMSEHTNIREQKIRERLHRPPFEIIGDMIQTSIPIDPVWIVGRRRQNDD